MPYERSRTPRHQPRLYATSSILCFLVLVTWSFASQPFTVNFSPGVTPRTHTADNDYLIDRDVQRDGTFSGISDFVSQDLMVTESMGPIYDRTQEHLGTIDKAIIRMRQLLIRSAKALAADGTAPPALAGQGHDFRTIRSAEKILEPGEDWRVLGTDDDPVVREARSGGVRRRGCPPGP
jgi:phthalate 4,5-dioxygenase oxygenase subunit